MASQKADNTDPKNTTRASDSLNALKVQCSICFDIFRAVDVVFWTRNCGHVFHKRCLMRWLKSSNTCPLCASFCNVHIIHRLRLNFSEVRINRNPEPEVDQPNPHFEWVPMNLSKDTRTKDSHRPPKGAVKCGRWMSGFLTHVARAYFNDNLLPAQYVLRKKRAFAAWDGDTMEFTEGVEVLVLRDCVPKWVASRNGGYPPDALPTGYSHLGEVTYTGRSRFGETRLGTVHPSYGKMFIPYIPYMQMELGVNRYEVLVVTPPVVLALQK
ncbi:uncharacterized protein LOC108090251 [Drosophila ficusphila]|uniref:uncharacterized protein LOC108090251 n=1 Tax=Drosophila ficusphila TaxID=30025 RepID=UPI0007E82173|nr:uncharacterized protein LOC108090251 [Drosophila ficusphila]